MNKAPTIEKMRSVKDRLSPFIVETQTQALTPVFLKRLTNADFCLKLELFQHTGTFKARGALNNVLSKNPTSPRLTAISAGNHAIAVAYAAAQLGGDAKVVMQNTANPVRIAQAKALGAEVLLVEPGQAGFDLAQQLAAEEDRDFIHPFDGEAVTAATGGVGLELMEAAPDLDAVIVAVGGGGLASGVAAAVKQIKPACAVYGVEPEGAAVMSRSFESGAALTLDSVSTIADSLAPPMTTPYAFDVCREFIDDLVTVSDHDIEVAMAITFNDFKLAVEPSGAAALAAAIGPLRSKISGKKVGLIVCGANIDHESFAQHVARGAAGLEKLR